MPTVYNPVFGDLEVPSVEQNKTPEVTSSIIPTTQPVSPPEQKTVYNPVFGNLTMPTTIPISRDIDPKDINKMVNAPYRDITQQTKGELMGYKDKEQQLKETLPHDKKFWDKTLFEKLMVPINTVFSTPASIVDNLAKIATGKQPNWYETRRALMEGFNVSYKKAFDTLDLLPDEAGSKDWWKGNQLQLKSVDFKLGNFATFPMPAIVPKGEIGDAIVQNVSNVVGAILKPMGVKVDVMTIGELPTTPRILAAFGADLSNNPLGPAGKGLKYLAQEIPMLRAVIKPPVIPIAGRELLAKPFHQLANKIYPELKKANPNLTPLESYNKVYEGTSYYLLSKAMKEERSAILAKNPAFSTEQIAKMDEGLKLKYNLTGLDKPDIFLRNEDILKYLENNQNLIQPITPAKAVTPAASTTSTAGQQPAAGTTPVAPAVNVPPTLTAKSLIKEPPASIDDLVNFFDSNLRKPTTTPPSLTTEELLNELRSSVPKLPQDFMGKKGTSSLKGNAPFVAPAKNVTTKEELVQKLEELVKPEAKAVEPIPAVKPEVPNVNPVAETPKPNLVEELKKPLEQQPVSKGLNYAMKYDPLSNVKDINDLSWLTKDVATPTVRATYSSLIRMNDRVDRTLAKITEKMDKGLTDISSVFPKVVSDSKQKIDVRRNVLPDAPSGYFKLENENLANLRDKLVKYKTEVTTPEISKIENYWKTKYPEHFDNLIEKATTTAKNQVAKTVKSPTESKNQIVNTKQANALTNEGIQEELKLIVEKNPVAKDFIGKDFHKLSSVEQEKVVKLIGEDNLANIIDNSARGISHGKGDKAASQLVQDVGETGKTVSKVAEKTMPSAEDIVLSKENKAVSNVDKMIKLIVDNIPGMKKQLSGVTNEETILKKLSLPENASKILANPEVMAKLKQYATSMVVGGILAPVAYQALTGKDENAKMMALGIFLGLTTKGHLNVGKVAGEEKYLKYIKSAGFKPEQIDAAILEFRRRVNAGENFHSAQSAADNVGFNFKAKTEPTIDIFSKKFFESPQEIKSVGEGHLSNTSREILANKDKFLAQDLSSMNVNLGGHNKLGNSYLQTLATFAKEEKELLSKGFNVNSKEYQDILRGVIKDKDSILKSNIFKLMTDNDRLSIESVIRFLESKGLSRNAAIKEIGSFYYAGYIEATTAPNFIPFFDIIKIKINRELNKLMQQPKEVPKAEPKPIEPKPLEAKLQEALKSEPKPTPKDVPYKEAPKQEFNFPIKPKDNTPTGVVREVTTLKSYDEVYNSLRNSTEKFHKNAITDGMAEYNKVVDAQMKAGKTETEAVALGKQAAIDAANKAQLLIDTKLGKAKQIQQTTTPAQPSVTPAQVKAQQSAPTIPSPATTTTAPTTGATPMPTIFSPKAAGTPPPPTIVPTLQNLGSHWDSFPKTAEDIVKVWSERLFDHLKKTTPGYDLEAMKSGRTPWAVGKKIWRGMSAEFRIGFEKTLDPATNKYVISGFTPNFQAAIEKRILAQIKKDRIIPAGTQTQEQLAKQLTVDYAKNIAEAKNTIIKTMMELDKPETYHAYNELLRVGVKHEDLIKMIAEPTIIDKTLSKMGNTVTSLITKAAAGNKKIEEFVNEANKIAGALFMYHNIPKEVQLRHFAMQAKQDNLLDKLTDKINTIWGKTKWSDQENTLATLFVQDIRGDTLEKSLRKIYPKMKQTELDNIAKAINSNDVKAMESIVPNFSKIQPEIENLMHELYKAERNTGITFAHYKKYFPRVSYNKKEEYSILNMSEWKPVGAKANFERSRLEQMTEANIMEYNLHYTDVLFKRLAAHAQRVTQYEFQNNIRKGVTSWSEKEFRELKESGKVNPNEWVKISEFGNRYYKSDILRLFKDIAGTTEYTGILKFVKGFSELPYMKQANNWWKFMSTVLPGFHIRNFKGNIWQAASEVGLHNMPAAGIQGAATMLSQVPGFKFLGKAKMPFSKYEITLDQAYNKLREGGLWNRGQYAEDVVKALSLTAPTVGQKINQSLNIFAPTWFGWDWSKKFGNVVENHARTSVGTFFMASGYNYKEAIRMANKVLFDYKTAKTPFERFMAVPVPFWTWTKNNTILWTKLLFNPAKAMPIYRQTDVITNPNFNPLLSQETKEELKIKPKWMYQADTKKTIMKDQFGNAIHLNFQNELPQLTAADVQNTFTKPNYDNIKRLVAGTINPLMTSSLQVLFGKELGTGREMKLEDTTVAGNMPQTIFKQMYLKNHELAKLIGIRKVWRGDISHTESQASYEVPVLLGTILNNIPPLRLASQVDNFVNARDATALYKLASSLAGISANIVDTDKATKSWRYERDKKMQEFIKKKLEGGELTKIEVEMYNKIFKTK